MRSISRRTVRRGFEELPDVDWDNPEALWDYYLEDVDFGDKTVLDPFMGGGTTIVEALRMGCNVIGSDLNPVAWFTVKKEIESVDIDDLQEAYDEIYESVGEEILEYYQTPCPDCDNMADAMYYFWVKEIECLNCGHDVPLFKGAITSLTPVPPTTATRMFSARTAGLSSRQTTILRRQRAWTTAAGISSCRRKGLLQARTIPVLIAVSGAKSLTLRNASGNLTPQMYAVEYYCSSCDDKGYKDPTDHDLELYERWQGIRGRMGRTAHPRAGPVPG